MLQCKELKEEETSDCYISKHGNWFNTNIHQVWVLQAQSIGKSDCLTSKHGNWSTKHQVCRDCQPVRGRVLDCWHSPGMPTEKQRCQTATPLLAELCSFQSCVVVLQPSVFVHRMSIDVPPPWHRTKKICYQSVRCH